MKNLIASTLVTLSFLSVFAGTVKAEENPTAVECLDVSGTWLSAEFKRFNQIMGWRIYQNDCHEILLENFTENPETQKIEVVVRFPLQAGVEVITAPEGNESMEVQTTFGKEIFSFVMHQLKDGVRTQLFNIRMYFDAEKQLHIIMPVDFVPEGELDMLMLRDDKLGQTF